MTETVQLALIALGGSALGGIPGAFVAWAAYRQSLINGIKAELVGQKVDATAAKVDTILVGAAAAAVKSDTLILGNGQVYALMNATNSNLQKSVDVMAERLAGNERMFAQMAIARADTAASQAVSDTKVAEALRAQPPGFASAPAAPDSTGAESHEPSSAAATGDPHA